MDDCSFPSCARTDAVDDGGPHLVVAGAGFVFAFVFFIFLAWATRPKDRP